MRMASRPDSHILLVTKQRQSQAGGKQSRERKSGEAGSSSSTAAAVASLKDEKELLDSEDEDDPEVKEAIAQSLSGDTGGELTQEEILRVIKKEARSRVKQEVKFEPDDEEEEGDDLKLADDQNG